MSSHENQINKTESFNEYTDSVDDMLATVDQFIRSVYQDLSLSPSERSSIANSSPNSWRLQDDETYISSVRPSSTDAIRSESKPQILSKVSRRNHDAEIQRIDEICNNVDQNLRSIGLFMDNSSVTNISEGPASTNLANSRSSPVPRMRLIRNHQKREPSLTVTVVEDIVDLSNSQTETPETRRRPFRLSNDNNDDDDVILVSAESPQVIDLSTPGGQQDISRSTNAINYELLNRRRLHQDEHEEETNTYAGPSSTKKRAQLSLPENETSSGENRSQVPFMCPVCMESCLQRQPTSTLCGHVFCKQCIVRAIELTRKCPMCNKKTSAKQIFRIYF